VGEPRRVPAHRHAPTRIRAALAPSVAWARIGDWLSAPVAWIPQPGPEHARLVGELVVRHDVRGNLVPDAQLAALALEHGVTVCSTDTDFARFREVRWHNPLTA
jgi:predicted nucleic acid-binding protein